MEYNVFVMPSFFVLFIKVIVYEVYRLCYLFTSMCNDILYQTINKKRHSSSKTAKYGRIVFRYKLSLNEIARSDFLDVCTARVRPDYVLKPNVSLYMLTNKEAIFVEMPENVNIYSSDLDPFFFVAQYQYAKAVIAMSIGNFVTLASQIGDPKVPVTWVSNTGRCGGTMLCQIFESVPGTLVIHEPNPPHNLVHLQRSGIISDDLYEGLLKSIIRVLCKPHPGTERICVKPRPICTSMMMDVSRLFPDIKQIFIYRNCMNTVQSWLAVMRYDAFHVVMRACADDAWLSKLCPYFRNLLQLNFVPTEDNSPDDPRDLTTACVFVCAWAKHVTIARKALSRDRSILTVKYEEIIGKPENTIKKIFDSFDLDIAYDNLALSSLSRHSQRGSFISRDIIGTEDRSLTEEDIREANCILAHYKLPCLGESYEF